MKPDEALTLFLVTLLPPRVTASLMDVPVSTIRSRTRRFVGDKLLKRVGPRNYQFTSEGQAAFQSFVDKPDNYLKELRWPFPRAAVDGDWLTLIEPEFFDNLPDQEDSQEMLDDNFARSFMKHLIILDQAIYGGQVTREIIQELKDENKS